MGRMSATVARTYLTAVVDSATVDFELTDEQRLLRDTVRDFAQQEVAPVAAEHDRTATFPYEIIAKLGELGLMGVPFPQEYGGGGADALSLALTIEELARVDCGLAITVAAHTSLGTEPIHLWGTEEQKARWLPQLCSGERLAAYGLTEPEAGSDAGNTRTTARLEDGEWVIDGSKSFITNPGTDISGCVTITAVTDVTNGRREISNIIVPNGTPGYDVGPPYRKMGWHSSDTRPLSFSDCRVPEGNLLGRRGRGFQQFMKAVEGGRIGVARWRGARPGRAGRGHRLREGAARVRPADLQVPGDPDQDRRHLRPARGDAAARLPRRGAEGPGQLFLLAAAQAKLLAGRLAVRATEEAVQIHGGYGYIESTRCAASTAMRRSSRSRGHRRGAADAIARQLGC